MTDCNVAQLSWEPPSVISSGARNLNYLCCTSFLLSPSGGRFLLSVEMTKEDGVEMSEGGGGEITKSEGDVANVFSNWPTAEVAA